MHALKGAALDKEKKDNKERAGKRGPLPVRKAAWALCLVLGLCLITVLVRFGRQERPGKGTEEAENAADQVAAGTYEAGPGSLTSSQEEMAREKEAGLKMTDETKKEEKTDDPARKSSYASGLTGQNNGSQTVSQVKRPGKTHMLTPGRIRSDILLPEIDISLPEPQKETESGRDDNGPSEGREEGDPEGETDGRQDGEDSTVTGPSPDAPGEPETDPPQEPVEGYEDPEGQEGQAAEESGDGPSSSAGQNGGGDIFLPEVP